MSIVFAVQEALVVKKIFDVDAEISKQCSSISSLLLYLTSLFEIIDNKLFQGAIGAFFKSENIVFRVVAKHSGPAGLTTFDKVNGMRVCINANGWVKSFPAMVGGTLCHRADTCLVKIFCHEFVHVLLFSIYLQLNLSMDEIKNSFQSHYDHTHNVLFMKWLTLFFGQDTIDNSLLLHTDDDQPLTFQTSVKDIEQTCIKRAPNTPIRTFLNGTWQETLFVKPVRKKPHFSKIRTKEGLILKKKKKNKKQKTKNKMANNYVIAPVSAVAFKLTQVYGSNSSKTSEPELNVLTAMSPEQLQQALFIFRKKINPADLGLAATAWQELPRIDSLTLKDAMAEMKRKNIAGDAKLLALLMAFLREWFQDSVENRDLSALNNKNKNIPRWNPMSVKGVNPGNKSVRVGADGLQIINDECQTRLNALIQRLGELSDMIATCQANNTCTGSETQDLASVAKEISSLNC